ncbi:hypothetical protein QBC34DRAFT_60151 [Podospora aff. communis PSN243]|uniref:DUF221 domain-containing protein n=1 Tax=Podospora aff. communis PSN243 TaxID=3040156 RepID=A0AAV9GPT1_9PEZI|nr:hypothetical protein QBC34DRAFT_60151 [Podospora aff. communis PSN243]
MEWSEHLVLHLLRRFNESADPRIGSGRDNSTGGTLSHADLGPKKDGDQASSLSTLGTTFVPVLVYSGICLSIFILLRKKCPRVYAPRTFASLRGPERPTPPLPDGLFNWIIPFLKIDNNYILNNCSLDAFFFLRFLRVLSIICLVGVISAWPILLPVHGTGGNRLLELERLTIGNIKLPSRYFAHTAVAWFFFGFVLFMICRECVYYINLRQAYLLSPNYAKRLSSRTVLFTCIPKPYLEEPKLRKLFGDSAKNIWIPRNTRYLRGLVEDREKTAERLEQAEIRLIRLANMARNRHLKKFPAEAAPKPSPPISSVPSHEDAPQEDPEKGKAESAIRFAERQLSVLDATSLGTENAAEKAEDPEYTHPYGFDPSLPDVRGSVAAMWIPANKRPYHRPIKNFGRRVDTIRWCRARLKSLNRDIWKLRRKHRGGDGSPLSAAFIEFDTQANAQSAFQILAHHQPLHMSPRFIGIRPEEINWSALRIKWWEHIMRRFLMMGVISVAIVFWSFPSAFVGMVSNLDELAKLAPFMKWIFFIPKPILDIIKGLLPALALSWLMAAVPGMLRACGRVAGIPSYALIELYVQNGYFAFQIVQVFLVTTLTSAASAALQKILADPLSVKDLLSENLPKASNFYLSYILVQCLAAGAYQLSGLYDLFRHQIIGNITVNPRKRFFRWRKLTQIHWGSEYPRFTNLGVIALSYTCIAPLVLLFAGLGMWFLSYTYRYNIIYVYDSDLDTLGLFYPRALMQLMFGLYVAEICLVGLFALKSAVGPMLLMLIFFIFTALVHISLNEAVTPLLFNLPRTLALERDIGPIAEDVEAEDDTTPTPDHAVGGSAAAYYDTNEHFGDEPEPPPLDELDTDIQMRGVEGSSSLRYAVTDFVKAAAAAWIKKDTEDSSLTRALAQLKAWLTPDATQKPNFIMTFFHPEVYQEFKRLQPKVNPGPDDLELPPDYGRKAYQPPEMWKPAPKLWIPKDDARVSRQEVAHTKESIFISDQGCWLNERCRVKCEPEESPLFEPVIIY